MVIDEEEDDIFYYYKIVGNYYYCMLEVSLDSFLFLIASSPFLFLKHHMFFIFDREKVKQLFICSDSYQLLLEEIKFDFRGLW